MRYAVLADVHGNAVALEAVLADLAGRGGADRIVNLGDCVSGPLWPRECAERLMGLDAVTVRGNHDRWVATLAVEELSPSDLVAHRELSAAQREWLGALPETAIAGPGLLACHGTPSSDVVYLIERIVDGELRRDRPTRIGERLGPADGVHVVLCGHSHRADLVRLANGTLILNPGSVGGPAYRDPTEPAHVSEAGASHARYALLDLTDDGHASAMLLAVPYAFEEAARQAEHHGRGDWAHALRTGFALR